MMAGWIKAKARPYTMATTIKMASEAALESRPSPKAASSSPGTIVVPRP
jgi:hypothetical protein